MRRRVPVSVLCGALLLVGAGSGPPAPLAEAHGDLDGDGREERVRLEADGTLRVDDADGRARGRLTLAPARSGTVAMVAVAGHPVVHARVGLAKGRAVEAVARFAGELQPIFEGRTGPIGDGDRSEHLRVDAAAIERWQTSPTVQRCDGEERLFRQRFDFVAGRFVPVDAELPEGAPLPAAARAPEGWPASPLGAFHFTAASSGPDAEGRADRLAAPHELEDGSPSTVWAGGAGDWAVARAQTEGRRVRALRIVPARGAAPHALRLVLGPRRAYRVELAPGDATWVTIPDGPPTACVALVLADAGALAEVALFTDADSGGGQERLVDEVAADGPDAEGAARMLAERGAAIVPALDAALGRHPPGRKRLLSVLAALAVPEAAAPLARALGTSDAAESRTIADGLVRLGDAGARAAAALVADGAQAPSARGEAAAVLAHLASSTTPSAPAVAALLTVGGDAPAALRAAARAGLGQAGARAPAVVVALADAFIAATTATPAATTPIEEHAADLARALGEAGHTSRMRARAAAALLQAAPRPDAFVLRLALLRAMGALGDPQLAPALDRAAHDPDDVLRWAAVQAAAALDDPAGRAIVRRAVDDSDPRVRREALTAIAAHPSATDSDLLARRAAGDAWPMVRQAAVEALGAACPSGGAPVEAVLVARLLGDGAEVVRRAALVALPRCPGVHGPLLVRVLGDRRQPPSVRELAAALLAKAGDRGVAPAIAQALDEVLADPSADERSAGVAVSCVRALGRLGDVSRPVLEALGAAANEPLSPAVRAAAMEAIGRLCPDGAGEALRQGANDSDPAVRRAAAEALARCRR